MPPQARFFPYDPRAARLSLLACAVVSALLGAWTLASARASSDVTGFARASLLVAQLVAFAWVSWRTRPRNGWGVRLDAMGLTVSRPLWGEPLQLMWSQLSELRREGRRRERLSLRIHPEGRLLLPRRMFASKEIFEALSEALEDRLGRRRLDS
jgi:hypothetical protein